MPKWTDFLLQFSGDRQAQVELMALMWTRAAAQRDDFLNDNLVRNMFTVQALAYTLDGAGVSPGPEEIEWARQRSG